MEQYLENEEDLISIVNELMKKLKMPKIAARLRYATKLSAKTNCLTRWSSTWEMPSRFLKIEQFLDSGEFEEIEDYLISTREVKKIQKLSEKLSDLNSITKELQKEVINLSTVRALFDSAMEDFDLSEHYLSSNADIILDPS